MAEPLDPRVTPARPDLAAASLRGKVQAASWAEPRRRVVSTPVAPMTAAPDAEAPTTTHLLFGEEIDIYDAKAGWAWGQATADGYVGYVPDACLSAPGAAPGWRVSALQAPVYPAPTIRSRPVSALPFGARVAAQPEGQFLSLAAGGYLCAQHASPASEPEPDWVDVATRFLGAPYIWGGRTAAGIDCSGLIQIARQAAGAACPRDSDMQAAEPGRPVTRGRERRGDLIFWRGHVGVMLSPTRLLHATGRRMAVVIEHLPAVEALIEAAGHGPVIARRRWSPPNLSLAAPSALG
ncbi:MAG: C40 family peptidase [Rubrimonas sp.]